LATVPFSTYRTTAGSPGEEPGWREWPSYIYVPAPGCFGYQVDGTSFSEVIVFEARIGE
jgi:hypothetical protein